MNVPNKTPPISSFISPSNGHIKETFHLSNNPLYFLWHSAPLPSVPLLFKNENGDCTTGNGDNYNNFIIPLPFHTFTRKNNTILNGGN